MAAYPVLDIVLGYFLLDEGISVVQLVLVGLICLSIIVLAMNQKKTDKAPHPIKGILFAILYMLLVACSTYFEKTIYINSFSVYDLYYYKGMIYTIVSVIFGMIVIISPVKMEKPNINIIKGNALAPIGNIIYSFGLNIGTMSVVATISSLYSVITNIVSRIFLKEKINIRERVCIATIIISTIILVVLGFVV
jgi:drug/metabolite transporter (DMT)-like permease